MRLLQLLLPLVPLASLVSADLEVRSAYTTSIVKTVYITIHTGKSHLSTVSQETNGGGGQNNGHTVSSVETQGGGGNDNGRTITSVETQGGGGNDNGRTITSVETQGGGGNDNGHTISSVETQGGGGLDNGIQLSTKTVTVFAAAGMNTAPARWQGAAAGVAVGMLGLL